jgi:hypothetical protein
MTLYLIDSGNKHADVERALKSLTSVQYSVVRLMGNVDFSTIQIPTEWGMFLYTDEWLSFTLDNALPVFLDSGYSVLNFYKMCTQEGEPKYFHCSRVFQRGVKIKSNSLEVEGDEVVAVTVLDGFLLS